MTELQLMQRIIDLLRYNPALQKLAVGVWSHYDLLGKGKHALRIEVMSDDAERIIRNAISIMAHFAGADVATIELRFVSRGRDVFRGGRARW